jgi:hypothetical protein
VQSILSQLVQIKTLPRPTTQSIYSNELQELRARVLRLREDIPADSRRRLAIEGMFQRIDTLLDKTEQVVQSRASVAEQARMPEKSEVQRRIPAIFARHRSR